ncbi:MAG: coproporphyrinogen III oxidase [Bacillaceae bacterium G1]|nr:coproporphyrinogen III oxidase [Bacillota bacterium]OJF18416.1 MAG: coproporphyrinogen III oxidase [Bacillaceae bacterium G1]
MGAGAVYVHIPFCTNKCYYCDFNSYVHHGQPVDDYLAALEQEMAMTVAAEPPGPIGSVFIGGGTPTVLSPEQLKRLLTAIRTHFPDWENDCEVTVEANPGTVDAAKLAALREGGVNRLSFGAQSFDAALLKRLGRIHRPEDTIASVEAARKAGFDNVSIDLMFGLPGQTLASFQETLRMALALDLPHYSVYSLILEENTPFYTWYQQGRLALPDEDEEVAMYELAIEEMEKAGYQQYEISNFSRPGWASRHNLTYWYNEEYYGIGAGAHGYVRDNRYENVRGIRDYIERVRRGERPIAAQHAVSRQEAMENFMILGLRLRQGVEWERFRRQFGLSIQEAFPGVLSRLTEQGLVEMDGRGLRLTRRGLLLGNDVFVAFLA